MQLEDQEGQVVRLRSRIARLEGTADEAPQGQQTRAGGSSVDDYSIRVNRLILHCWKEGLFFDITRLFKDGWSFS